MKDIIFVCTGNTCRSPIAEGFAKKYVHENGLHYQIRSRGIAVWHEESVNPNAVQALSDYQIDIAAHKAKQIQGTEITKDTVILTMGKQHREYLKHHYPEFEQQIHTIKGFVGLEGDVDDPYSKPLQVYQLCARELNELIGLAFKKLGGSI